MNRFLSVLTVTLAAVCLWCAGAAAELYVTESFEITLRAGPGLDYKILEMLPSGAPLEKLGENEGWIQVRTTSGAEGWIVQRYLSETPPKGPQLAAARAELEDLRARLAANQEALREARRSGGSAADEAATLAKRLAAVEQQFAQFKADHQDVIAIRERAENLEREQESTRAELERLRVENRSLQAREKFYWFFSGVIVLLSGWILGYLYCSSRNRSRGQAKLRF